MSPVIFDSKADPSGDCLLWVQKAYSGVTSFKIGLSAYGDNPCLSHYHDLTGFPELLKSMPSLKHLHVDLPEDYKSARPEWMPYSLLFPKDGKWPDLTAFNIKNITITTTELVTLLLLKMPNLRNLTIDCIELLDGGWEGIFEMLRVTNKLSSPELPMDCELIQPDMFFCTPPRRPSNEYDQHSNFIERTMIYVIDWRSHPFLTHPCLAPNTVWTENAMFLGGIV